MPTAAHVLSNGKEVQSTMAMKDLVPWDREHAVDAARRRDDLFGSLHREMSRLFEDFARGFDLAPFLGSQGFAPRIDVRETDEEVLVLAEIPGLEEKDFELSLTAEELTLRGEKRGEREEKGSLHRLERSYGAFERTISLPCEVEADKASATYRNGVLNVTLPKAPSARRRVHRIEVTPVGSRRRDSARG
jgi:HSP20 family protein